MAEYTFYPKFQEFVTLYRGVVRVWIGNGIDTGQAGMLFAEYIDGAIQSLGMVSDYNEAKAYFAELGIDLTYKDWVALLSQTPENARAAQLSATHSEISSQQSEAWAVGQRQGTDVPDTDPTYRNNSKHYSTVAEQYSSDASDSASAALASEQAAQAAQNLAETAQSSAETAQSLAEAAQSAAEIAQGNAETAQHLAETAQLASETAQGFAEAAQSAAETAQGLAETAQTAAEDAQELAEIAQSAAETAQGLSESARDAAQTYMNQAAGSASNAADSAANAASSEATALACATNAATSESNAASSESNAAASEANAAESEIDAEAWAVGERNGVVVVSPDITYHNNSKYYAEQAGISAQHAATSESNAATSEANAHESAVYAYTQAESVKGAETESFYQNSQNGTTPPTGPWSTTPSPVTGRFMWIKTIITWTDSSTSEIYSVSYIGANGTGSVNSVNSKGGDVVLYAFDISMSDVDSTNIGAKISEFESRFDNVATQADIDALFS